ncbi:MAG: hypothetical protein WB290_08440 [Smithella sp.]
MAEKKCKYCAMVISTEAKICPYCRKKQSSTFLKFIGGFFIFILFASFIGQIDKGTNQQKQEENTTVNEEKSAEPIPINLSDINIQALDYVNDYKNNRKKYEERTVLITGKISGIFIPPPSVRSDMTKKGLSAGAFIYFSDKPVSDATQTLMDDGVSCYIDESLEANASQMHIGQTITLRCKHAAIQTLSECTLADEIPSTTSETQPEHTDSKNSPQKDNTDTP